MLRRKETGEEEEQDENNGNKEADPDWIVEKVTPLPGGEGDEGGRKETTRASDSAPYRFVLSPISGCW